MSDRKKRVLDALALKKPDKVPFMELGIDHDMGKILLGKDNYEQHELADFMGIDALGVGLYPQIYAHFHTADDGRSYVGEGKLADRDCLSMINLPDPNNDSMYDNVKRMVDAHGKDYAIYANSDIGLSPLLLGMGLENLAYNIADETGVVEEILDIYTEWSSVVAKKVMDAGVDMIWYTDDIAFNTSLMFSPDFFKETCIPRLKKVTDQITIPKIYHTDGFIYPVMEEFIEDLGINALHPMDPGAMDIEQVKKEYGHRVCLMGNIDLRHTLVHGTVEEVEQEVKDRIEKIGYNGGYIISSANTITAYCNPKNIIAMRDAIAKYR